MPSTERAAADDRDLAATLTRRLAEDAGIYAAVRVAGGVAYLEGVVDSASQRDAATDIAQGLVGIDRVQNDLDVEELDPALSQTREEEQEADVTYEMLEGDQGPNPLELAPDFSEGAPAAGDDMTDDAMVATEEGIPYSPPTDPVVRPAANDQGLEVVVGFGTTSMDEYPDAIESTALGAGPPGDEDLEERVLQELAADAATTDFFVNVAARNGVVRLRGRVPSLEDAEAIEAVAARVPGVREVVEELDVAGMEGEGE
ncbi:MAG TPA: BON domain-containing protein [Thermomicrobiales bacterium]|nr:BON domain-containing protein [Thermomicrobiales bacterium]